MVWIDGKIKSAQVGDTSVHVPIRLEAAMQSQFMKEREVIYIVRKIAASLQDATFPLTVDTLDGLLMDHCLTTGQRICLKSALTRAGLLR
jgi:hypothetical protein